MWKEIKWFRDVATYDALTRSCSFLFLSFYLSRTYSPVTSLSSIVIGTICVFWSRMCTSLFLYFRMMMIFVVMYFNKTDHTAPNENRLHFSFALWSLISSLFVFWQRFFFLLFSPKKTFCCFSFSVSGKKTCWKKILSNFFISFLFVLIFLGYWPLRFLCTDVKCCCFASLFF